jgi:NADPH2:quinone reductase
LKEVDVPTPRPGPRQVLVRVTATGIGFVDGLLIQGLYQVKPRLPFHPASEYAGVVETVGAECSRLAVGDRVFGSASGALSEFVCVDEASCCSTPEPLTDAQAGGLFINYLTAIYGLRDCGNLQPGETVLVLGAAGGVGSAAIAVARAMGAQVIGAASTEAKRRSAMAAGAHAAVDYTAAHWRDDLKTALAGKPLHMVYDPVGGDASEPALRSLSPGGRFLVVGFASGTIAKIPLNLPLLKRCAIVGVDWGGDARQNPHINGPLAATLVDWISSGRLTPAPITERPAARFVQAFEDQLAGRVVGKLVLVR